MNGTVLNIIVIILDAAGLSISFKDRRFRILYYYTQLSNIVTFLSCILYILAPGVPAVTAVRYLSTCMLVMTFLITVCVLVPMGGGFRTLMLESSGLYHHTLCPLISVFSYLMYEPHSGMLALPVILTVVYGLSMLLLNCLRVVDGPYPFFRVYRQSAAASVLWTIALTVIITVISCGVMLAASLF